jgi:RNA polymerase sigma-70 factor, ECF subfamily
MARPGAGSDLSAIYQRCGPVVYRRARRLLGDEQWAKDVTQEVFVRLWKAGLAFPEGGAVAWLYRVTTNLCLNERRDARRLAELHQRARAAGNTPPEVPIDLILHGIPEELHAIAIYYYVDQMSQDEIAAALGVSQRTVSNRLKEFRQVIAASDATKPLSNTREVS